ncbi:MAG: glycosyltransferase [Bacteroidales bacterium]|nr:glycosyltransferase [Bacteroidales bacterium]
MIKVSVILPVYGVAKYVVKCTESLLSQTLHDMEFIFVDDHGPDNSIDLIKKTISGHERESQFVFLKPEHNLGAGMARNYAIPYAKGEYVAFVDSDDWVEPTMFEDLYLEAVRCGRVDLCYCQASKDFLDGKPSRILKNPIVESGAFTREKRSFFLVNYISLFWTFLYRKEHIEQSKIRYPEERSADDSYFVTCNIITANTIAHVDKPLYHYLIRPGSVVTTKDSTKYRKRLAVFSHLLEYARVQGIYDEFKQEIDYVYIKKGFFSSILNYVYNTASPQYCVIGEIIKELKLKIPDYNDNKYYRNRKALCLLVFLLSKFPRLAIVLFRLYVKNVKPTV